MNIATGERAPVQQILCRDAEGKGVKASLFWGYKNKKMWSGV
jgi:hypothetical protein